MSPKLKSVGCRLTLKFKDYSNFRYTSESNQSVPLPLSEQELVIPSWRTNTPPINRRASNPLSSVNTNRSPSPHVKEASSTSSRTIWDPPNDRPHSALSHNQHVLPPKNHFSFVPKADTKPGAITPTRVNIRSRPSRSSTKAKSAFMDDLGSEKQDSHKDFHYRTQSMPTDRQEWPECYNSFHKLQGQCATGAKPKESTPLKSCLKSDSRSNSLARASKTRSKSPSSRASPAKQNVNFKQESEYRFIIL